MTLMEIKNELSVLDKARYFYKGEIYDSDMVSIGFIPDLTHIVAKELDMDWDEEEHLDEYCQVDLAERCVSDYEYAKVLKNFLAGLMLDYITIRRNQ